MTDPQAADEGGLGAFSTLIRNPREISHGRLFEQSVRCRFVFYAHVVGPRVENDDGRDAVLPGEHAARGRTRLPRRHAQVLGRLLAAVPSFPRILGYDAAVARRFGSGPKAVQRLLWPNAP